MGLLKGVFDLASVPPEIYSRQFEEKIEEILNTHCCTDKETAKVIDASGGLAKALEMGVVILVKKAIPLAVETDMRSQQDILDAKAASLKKSHPNLDAIKARSAERVDVIVKEYIAVLSMRPPVMHSSGAVKLS